MNRRQILIGLGTVAVGGGAAFGSGAFSSVEADRTVNVQLAGDGAALLGLIPLNTSVATTSQGTIALDFATGSSSGINYNAVTEFVDVFRITNNGDDNVSVHIDNNAPNAAANLSMNTGSGYFYYDGDSNGETANDPLLEFYLRDTGTNTVPAQGNADAFVGSGNAVALNAGTSKDVQVRFDTQGVTSADVGAANELIGELQIVAD